MQERLDKINSEKIKTLINTALGREKADLVIANADLVDVYSGELLKGWSVAIKGDRIAYVGENAEHTIGPDTEVIDATGKVLVPGFIDSHTHFLSLVQADEFLRYAMLGGTTTIISETCNFVLPLGYRGVLQFLESTADQPVKIFVTVAPAHNISPVALSNLLCPEELRRLLKRERVLGLGETSWPFIVEGDEKMFRLHAETLNAGKFIEGHSTGARGNNLQAYVASGVSSCHESTTAAEALERLRLGLHVMIREGDARKDLEAVAGIKDEPIDFRRLVLCTDGVRPPRLMKHGYMEFVIQKAIDLGFDPVVAIQMATLNAAEHFSLDNDIGGIAPGKYADMVILSDLHKIEAEMVISNGRITARDGRILVQPRKHIYPRSVMKSVHIPGKLRPEDFIVRASEKDKPVTVRVINQINEMVTMEEKMVMTPKDGQLEMDVDKDILKVSFIDRTHSPGEMFTGFIKGFGLKKGAFATSVSMGLSGVTVVGTTEEDMAGAVNRIKALQGGVVLYSDGEVVSELPLPIAGFVSDLSVEEAQQRYEDVRQKAIDMGSSMQDSYGTVTALSTTVIPFLRICESGLMDVKRGVMVDLICD